VPGIPYVSIGNRPRQTAVPYHSSNVQVLHHHAAAGLGYRRANEPTKLQELVEVLAVEFVRQWSRGFFHSA